LEGFERGIVDAQRQLKALKGTWLDVSPHDSELRICMNFQFLCSLTQFVSNIQNTNFFVCAFCAVTVKTETGARVKTAQKRQLLASVAV